MKPMDEFDETSNDIENTEPNADEKPKFLERIKNAGRKFKMSVINLHNNFQGLRKGYNEAMASENKEERPTIKNALRAYDEEERNHPEDKEPSKARNVLKKVGITTTLVCVFGLFKLNNLVEKCGKAFKYAGQQIKKGFKNAGSKISNLIQEIKENPQKQRKFKKIVKVVGGTVCGVVVASQIACLITSISYINAGWKYYNDLMEKYDYNGANENFKASMTNYYTELHNNGLLSDESYDELMAQSIENQPNLTDEQFLEIYSTNAEQEKLKNLKDVPIGTLNAALSMFVLEELGVLGGVTYAIKKGKEAMAELDEVNSEIDQINAGLKEYIKN